MKSCQQCCSFISNWIPFRFRAMNTYPVVKINMYNSDSDDNDDLCNASSQAEQQLLPYNSKNTVESNLEDLEAQFLSEEIDESGLKIYCQERIRLIQKDMIDPYLTQAERLINNTNLAALNNILTNIRLSEKIKLGSLRDSQYTDAVILQKQVLSNFAGQREYSDLIKPVIFTQPQSEGLTNTSDPYINQEESETETKSILKKKKQDKNNISGTALAV